MTTIATVSVIIATHNRGEKFTATLTAASNALLHAGIEGEIVVVDNGSTDNTSEIARAWSMNNQTRLKLCYHPIPGKARALNVGLSLAEGEFLIFTDDDCWLDVEYVNDLLRHFAGDGDLVVRGGRVELGNPEDLPLTINTSRDFVRWRLADNSVRSVSFIGQIIGANTATRRSLFERIGTFDENFGPGAVFGPCDDTDILCRAYMSGVTLEYVPDMIVYHHHGRKRAEEGAALMRQYEIGNGAIYSKYLFRHANFCRPVWWDFKIALKETAMRANFFLPEYGVSYKNKIYWNFIGAMRYALFAKDKTFSQAK